MPLTDIDLSGLEELDLSNIERINGADLHRREKLLWIASRLFLHKGYIATSVDEIAESAGTTGPAIYRFFNGKQDILDNICVIGMEMKLKGVHAAIDKGHPNPKKILRELVRNRVDFAFGPWGYQVPITQAEYRHLSPAAVAKVDTASEISTSEWFRCLSQVRPEVPTSKLLTIIYAVVTEITYVALHIDELDLQEDIKPFLERLAWAGLTS